MQDHKLIDLLSSYHGAKTECCKALGIERATLDKWLKKGDLSVRSLEKIAQFFSKPMSYFFDEQNLADKELLVKYEALKAKHDVTLRNLKDAEKIIALYEKKIEYSIA